MRYIEQDELIFPDDWPDRAAAAARAVEAGADPNDHSAVWRELKDALAALFPEKKCWYCESPVDRSDNAVDHFRPKGRVSDAAKPHAGYRWLAFAPDNFRYSCTFCNSRRKDVEGGTSGGKADRFPLIDEAKRLYAPGDTKQEFPELLDPCRWGDWELLGCKQENGKPCAATANSIERRRAETSIEVYHLDYAPTCIRRHRVAVALVADVAQAKRLFALMEVSPELEHDFFAAMRRIRKTIGRKAEFSGEMIFLLRAQRHSDHPWIDKLLEVH